MSKLVLLATYWNEDEWIERSLKQIDNIKPDFSIICDGCFDESRVNKSDDGTREAISDFCSKQSNRLMFSAIRGSRLTSLFKLLIFGLKKKFSLAYIYWVVRHCVFTDKYRLNQAVTFNKMLEHCINKFGDDFWFMTYDADQFYSDEFIYGYREAINSSCGYKLLIAKEMTFNNGFDQYNDHYEKRNWNNLPHKHMKNSVILPTRDIKIASLFKLKFYANTVKTFDFGHYFHYKFRVDSGRADESYKVGDRKQPSSERMKDTLTFKGCHPKVIREFMRK